MMWVVSLANNLISFSPSLFFDLRLDEGGFENYKEILQQYLKFVACMYLC